MLYEEMTKMCPDCTFEQFEILERIYMTCGPVQKEDIAKIWRMTYGKQIRLAKRLRAEKVASWVAGTADDIKGYVKDIVKGLLRADTHEVTTLPNVQLKGSKMYSVNSHLSHWMIFVQDAKGAWLPTPYRYDSNGDYWLKA